VASLTYTQLFPQHSKMASTDFAPSSALVLVHRAIAALSELTLPRACS
jgi:hypothetical protein